MTSLNLKKEFDILFDSHSQKMKKDEQMTKIMKPPVDQIEAEENSNLIRVLIRCKKMYECF